MKPDPCWGGRHLLHHSASDSGLGVNRLLKPTQAPLHRPYTAPDLRKIMAKEEKMAQRSSLRTSPSVMITHAPKPKSALDRLKDFVLGLPPHRTGEKTLDGAKVDRWGGHTYFEHVGKTDVDLEARLTMRADRIKAATTFPDIDTTENVLEEALLNNSDDISAWLATAKQGQVLQLSCKHRNRIGAGYFLGNDTKVLAQTSCIVLRREEKSPTGYVVFTAYPWI